jgi:hypothetical protein
LEAGVIKSSSADDLLTRRDAAANLDSSHELPTLCGSIQETAMTTFHQLRSPLIATVAAVTLVLAGHASRQVADDDAVQAASLASAAPTVELAEPAAPPEGGAITVVQLQSDLDLVGASIAAYDR